MQEVCPTLPSPVQAVRLPLAVPSCCRPIGSQELESPLAVVRPSCLQPHCGLPPVVVQPSRRQEDFAPVRTLVHPSYCQGCLALTLVAVWSSLRQEHFGLSPAVV